MKLKNLANSDKKQRNEALVEAENYLIRNPNLTEIEYLRLWKGIHYCYWMADTRQLQAQYATEITTIIFKLNIKAVTPFLSTFWSTIAREWYNIDAHRYFIHLQKG